MHIDIYNKCKKYIRNFIFRIKYSKNRYDYYFEVLKIFTEKVDKNCTKTIYGAKHNQFIKEIFASRCCHTDYYYHCIETSYPLFTVSNDGRSIDVFVSDKDTVIQVGDIIYLDIITCTKK